MEKKSAVIYDSWLEGAEVLTKDEGTLGRVVLAIWKYSLRGEDYTGNNRIVRSVFIQAKPLIDAYNHRAAGGRKSSGGGAPTGNGNAKKQQVAVVSEQQEAVVSEQQVAVVSEQQEAVVFETPENNKDVDVDVDVDVYRDSSAKASESSSAGAADADFAASLKAKTDLSKKAAEMVLYYNSRVAETGSTLPSSTVPPPEHRRHAVAARLREYGEEAVRRVIDNAVGSAFLNSRRFGIDWIMGPKNFPKALEGNYDNNERKNGNGNKTDNTRAAGPLWTPTEDQREHPERYYESTFHAEDE